ncbi:MAP kinase-interacting serine/threonine-protein kinase 1 [Nymphaea thermarum]|nr:MAP kinase-interacting serine/threonine-protein kinase 1 [Nymphaea thermarum]
MKHKGGYIQLVPNHSFTYEQIVEITRDFEILIGEGGSGTVYYGHLNNGKEVAVKVLNNSQGRLSKEFVAEVKILMTVHHKNLVSFVGFCEEDMNMIVLYEYMQNGSLREFLSGTHLDKFHFLQKNHNKILNMEEAPANRFGCRNWYVNHCHLVSKASSFYHSFVNVNILASSCNAGLEYLHSGCRPAIIHRDIKTANILLNEQLEAKLADFGISRADGKTQTSTVQIAGTLGYIDPEYVLTLNRRSIMHLSRRYSETSILTKKSDVYSFGVVLFELMCGRTAIFGTLEQHFHIVEWATTKIVRGDIESIVDPRIKGQHKRNSMWKVVDVALACTARRSTERPNMSIILKDLNEAMEMETGYQM